MRLHRFFVDKKLEAGKEIEIADKALAKQLKSVFRLRAGDEIMLLDDTGFEYHTHIMLLTGEMVRVRVTEEKESPYLPARNVYLFSSLIKKDHYEWVLEKCTELGVSHFIPVVSERTEKKDINPERAEKIIKEAAEQSEKGKLPLLHDVMTLHEAVQTFPGLTFVAFHLEGETFSRELHAKDHDLGIFIGPEGGWSEKELVFFKENNIPLVTLGKQVLRAETAAVAIATLLLL